MIAVAMAFLKEVPLKVWAMLAGLSVVLGLLAWGAAGIYKLKADLAATRAELTAARASVAKTEGRLEISEKRVADIDLRTKWLLKEFGETLPKTEEEARQWALRAAKEIAR